IPMSRRPNCRSHYFPCVPRSHLMSDSIHIVCPHCQSINRVPANKLAEKPNCGRCQHPLFTGEPIDLTTATFARHLERSELPLLVDFWAPWCGPCKMMAPQFERAASLLEPKVRLAKVNTEANLTLGSSREAAQGQ